ncbi:hypothetical protein [Methylobacterium fujisawaense]
MRRVLYLLAFAFLPLLCGEAQAQNVSCSPFSGWPLNIKLGTAPLGIGAESTRCANQKLMDAVNTLANTAIGQNTQLSTLKSTAAPSLTQFYSGQNALMNLVFDTTAQSVTQAEQTGAFRMTSYTGAQGGVSAYKMALGMENTCYSGSADCWAATAVLTTKTGYPASRNQIAFEVDQNNDSGTDCGDADLGQNGTVGCGGLLITGAGTNQVNFGLAVAGYSKVRNGVLFPSGGVIASSIRDYSSSISVLYDTGSHANGIALSGTYSANAIASPGFTVSPTGVVNAAALTTGGPVTSLYQKLTPVTFATVASQRPCNSTNAGNMAFIIDSNTTTFNAAVAGGGANAMAIICNGGAYVVH